MSHVPLTTPDPICCKKLEPVPLDELPVIKEGGHIDGRRLVNPPNTPNAELDEEDSIGVLELELGIPPL